MLRKESIAIKKNIKQNNKKNLKSKTLTDVSVLETRVSQAKTKESTSAFWPNPPHALLFPNSTGDAISLPQTHCTNDLGAQVDCSHSPSSPDRRSGNSGPGGWSLSSGVLSEGCPLKFVFTYNPQWFVLTYNIVCRLGPLPLSVISQSWVATRCVPGMRHFSYPEQLDRL